MKTFYDYEAHGSIVPYRGLVAYKLVMFNDATKQHQSTTTMTTRVNYSKEKAAVAPKGTFLFCYPEAIKLWCWPDEFWKVMILGEKWITTAKIEVPIPALWGHFWDPQPDPTYDRSRIATIPLGPGIIFAEKVRLLHRI